MNLDELRSVQAKERRKDSLQHLRDTFYDDVAGYITDLRAARDRRADRVDNPFSDDDIRRMSDEIETAEEVAEALYERRVGKVVKLASFAAADMPVDSEGMTSQERDLFEDLVARIERNKGTVLDVLAGEEPVGTTEEPVDAPGEADGESSADAARPDAAAGSDPASSDEGRRGAADDPPIPPDDPPGRSPDPEAGSGPASQGSDPPGPASQETGDGSTLADAMGGDGSSTAGERSGDDAGPTPVAPESAPPGAPDEPDVGTESDVPAAGAEPGGSRTSGASGGEGLSTTGDDSAADDASPVATDRTTVRITRNVGEIFGVDEREYDLASDDVVTLPSANAQPLLEHGAAEEIDAAEEIE